MPKKILLVDDTITVTTLEKVILGDRYEFIEARNGDEACQRARRDCPDLILMDVNMPVMNGVEALRSLKEDRATAAIPVVMVTTRSEAGAQETCRSLGCADLITKPINHELLRSTVKRFIG